MVLRSWPVRRAMAETDRPCRARSRIMTSSPRVTTGCSQNARGHPGAWPALPGPRGSPPGPGSGAELRNFQPALPGRIHPAATRVTSGLAKGELEWHRPNRATLSEMLHNPLYAGAYSYGRRPRPQRCRGGRATAEAPVLIKGWLPAYISWETYERNLAQMAANRAQWQGVVRGGSALLAGLVVCGRCGQRMVTQYPNNGSRKRYACTRLASDYGGPYCQSLSGTTLDAQLAELMLQTLTPAALEVSLQLAEDLELERTALHRQWQQRLERARYD